MKTKTLTALFLIGSFTVSGQSVPDSVYFSRLYYTCKVWGFVKYFHPRVADRTVEYDAVLLDVLPKVRNAQSQADFDQVLAGMINEAGEVPEPVTPPVEVPADLRYNLDLSWFNDATLSNEVKQQLNLIYDRFRPREHCLVRDASGFPYFDMEKDISDKNYQIESQRLLSLFRYWNMIRYFYPYTNILDQTWDSTLQEFIPRCVAFTNVSTYYRVWEELVVHLNTSHASLGSRNWYGLFPDSKPYYFPDFSAVRIGENTVIQNVKPGTIGVKPGDIVTKVNGRNIQTLRDLVKPRMAAGNESAAAWQTDNYSILRGDSTGMEMELVDDNGTRTVRADCKERNPYYNIYQASLPLYRDTLLNGSKKVTIVNMGLLQPDSVPPMGTSFWNSDCIIFDIRSYPNGSLYKLMDCLYTGPVHFVSYLFPSCTYPGTFIRQEGIYQSQGNNPYRGQVILLVNEKTMSHGEYTAMALKLFPGAVVIGRQTAGADGNVYPCLLLAYMRTYFEVLGIFNPDGSPTQRVGIKIDIPVNLTIPAIRDGKDEYLETAFNYITLSTENRPLNAKNALSVYPNPVDGMTQFSVAIDQPGPIDLVLLDGSGRTVRTLKHGTLMAGNHILTADLGALPSGIYFVRLITGETTVTSQLIKN